MSPSLGPPVFPEKSGFPEEAFLGRAWCSDWDVLTVAPCPGQSQARVCLIPHSQQAHLRASSLAQVILGTWVMWNRAVDPAPVSREALHLGGCPSIKQELCQHLRPSFSHRGVEVTQGCWVSLEPCPQEEMMDPRM